MEKSTSSKKQETFVPLMITCQRSGCPQRHRTRFLNGFFDFDELSGERTIGDPGVVQLKPCARCKQVHYCSVTCQRADWKERHRLECNNYYKRIPHNIDIASANSTSDLKVLMHIFQNCITSGEERDWISNCGGEEAREVDRRLFAIGGFDLCVSVCDLVKKELATDERRAADGRALEIIWADPVIPGWRT